MGIKGLSATATKLYDQLSDEDRREFFTLIDAEATRLSRVAEQIAAILLIEANAMDYAQGQVALGELLHAREPDPRVDLSDVAQSGGPTAAGDPKRAAEVIDTVLDNALRYSQGTARAVLDIDGATVRLQVVDDGVGLPLDQAARAFERFSNVRPPGCEDQPGAGLGLFLARTHARSMGGELTMEPGPQGGTIMTFTLPLET